MLVRCRTQSTYAQKYGPIFATHQIFQPIVMVESPELARKVLIIATSFPILRILLPMDSIASKTNQSLLLVCQRQRFTPDC